jgi:hypothetical protein
MIIRSGSDDGIHEKLRELLNYYRHIYSDFGIFSNKSSTCIRKVSFGEVKLMTETINGHRNSSMISILRVAIRYLSLSDSYILYKHD